MGKLKHQYTDEQILQALLKAKGIKAKAAKALGMPKSTYFDRLNKLDKVVEYQPKILFFDIETAPILGYLWSMWQKGIGLDQIDTDWFMLTWSAKWYGDNKILNDKLTNYDWTPGDDSGDFTIVLALRDLLDEADFVVGHNSDKFDIKKLNARCVIHGIKPPSPYRSIDTLKITKSQFGFTSNRLDYLANKLLGHGKIKTDMKLWTRCYFGDKKAFKEMQEYSDKDVQILEEVYEILAPWDKRCPSVAPFLNIDHPVCTSPICGSSNIEKTGKTVKTNLSEFEHYVCLDCGHHMRGRKNLRSKQQMQNSLMNI